MKRMVSIVVGSAALMCGAASVETATFEEIASDAQVVTAVDLSGLASEAAIPTKASQVGVTLDKGEITIDGEAITPLTSETDPAWRAWTNGTSVAVGAQSKASGVSSTALGMQSKAYESASTAVGARSNASGRYSTAVGMLSTTTRGYYSTVVGYRAEGGWYATALGMQSKASGMYSMALGAQSKAYAQNSVAIGYGAVASNTYAVAIGDGTPSEPYTYEYETIINEDGEEEVITNSSATVIGYAFAAGIHATALGYMAYAPAYSLGLAYTPDTILLCSSNTTDGAGSTARSLQSYLDDKADKSAIPDVSKFITADAISASNATFSNAVLAVRLNIDTNTLAAINELSTIDYTTPATTVGALLAALAAGLAALKKKTTTIETKVDAANTALEEVA